MPYPERLSFLKARRGLVPRLASTGYVVAVAMRAEGALGMRVWGLGGLALGLSATSSRLEPRASSIAIWGTSLALASLAISRASPWMDAVGIVGALVAGISAAAAIARMSDRAEASPTLVARRDRSPALASAVLSIGWVLALAATVGSAIEPAEEQDWMAARAQLFAVCAALVCLIAILTACAATLSERQFVLGVADRARVARGVVAAGFACAVVAAALGRDDARADRVLRLAVAAVAAFVALVSLHGDAVRIARGARRAALLAIVGGPIVLLAARVADGRWAVVFVGTLVALVAGSFARELEGPLRPAEGRWLDALEHAQEVLRRADADAALRAALEALRRPAGPQATSPELWTLDPVRVLSIDAAGYARERPAELPEGLLTIAAAEPEATLRTEVLESLEVRRPDLRRLARWMSDREALSLTVIAAGGEPLGLLLLPRGHRVVPVTLEEARAMKVFADLLAAACEARAALARSLTREQRLVRRAEEAEERVLSLEHARSTDTARNELAASRLARPAAVGFYAASSRMAFEALEKRIKTGAPVAVVCPSGVEAVSYLARAHLAGPRRAEPFVVVDGTSTREHDPARWGDRSSSPLALAARGTLLLVDGAALPIEVQRVIAEALAERRAPWEGAEPLDIALAFSATAAPAALVAEGRLDRALAVRLADAMDDPVTLPRLGERAEDLRAILTDRLAREGLRVRGAPVGIDDAAFARLAEYAFPGEDAEVRSIVQRLVAGVRGDVVRAADVDALALSPPSAEPDTGAGVRRA